MQMSFHGEARMPLSSFYIREQYEARGSVGACLAASGFPHLYHSFHGLKLRITLN